MVFQAPATILNELIFDYFACVMQQLRLLEDLQVKAGIVCLYFLVLLVIHLLQDVHVFTLDLCT
jgi:hypothetical protein